MTEIPTNPQPEPPPVRDGRNDGPLDPQGWEDAAPVSVPLRSGYTADLAVSRVVLDELRRLQQKHPDRFAALLAVCRGEPADEQSMRELSADRFLLQADGTPKPLTRAVLESSVLETAEGIVLREAIDLSDERVRQAYRESDERSARNIGRFFNSESDDAAGRGQTGPSR